MVACVVRDWVSSFACPVMCSCGSLVVRVLCSMLCVSACEWFYTIVFCYLRLWLCSFVGPYGVFGCERGCVCGCM